VRGLVLWKGYVTETQDPQELPLGAFAKETLTPIGGQRAKREKFLVSGVEPFIEVERAARETEKKKETP